MERLVVRTRAFSDDLKRAAVALEDATWSRLGYLNHTQAHQKYYNLILEEYADLQLCLVQIETGEPVALANCVPVPYDRDLDALPPEGWDWLVETGATRRHERPNLLGALAVSVPPAIRCFSRYWHGSCELNAETVDRQPSNESRTWAADQECGFWPGARILNSEHSVGITCLAF